MYYINLIIIAIFLSSCASTSSESTKNTSETSPLTQSDSEIQQYRTAITLLNDKNFEEAKKIFTEFSEKRPGLAGAYFNLALIAIQNHEPEEAFKFVNTALDKNPNLAQALNLLGFLEQEQGKIQQAEKHYLEAIKNKNDYAIAHYNIALLYDVYLQDINKAIIHYEKYMKITNNKDKKTADWLEHLKSSRVNG
jgi:tetratricopeptide (TPR) repeat protein